VLALAYAPDGRTLAAGAFTQHVHLWDTGAWKETLLKGHKSEVRAVAYSPDGKTLVTGGVGELRVWDTDGRLKRTVKHPDTVWSAAFSPDGKAIAVGSGQPGTDRNGAAGLWSVRDWSETQKWSVGGGMVASVALSPDGTRLAFGRKDGTVELHDLAGK
jgi:WD40 repeat protein